MNPYPHSRTPNFSQNPTHIQPQSAISQQKQIQTLQIDDNFQFAFPQFFQKYQQQEKQQQNSQYYKNTLKKYVPIKKEQLEKVFKYFKKYPPIYLNKIQVKQLSLKFKNGVDIKKYKEGYYFGQVLKYNQSYINENGQEKKLSKLIKHGKGIFVYGLFQKNQENNGSNLNQCKKIYQGFWQHDKKQGLGLQRFTDGSVYHGYYHLNKPQDKGRFTNAQGQTYQGTWKSGIRHGQGFWKNLYGQTYIGQFIQGVPAGYGVFVNIKGDRYEGQFKNSLKHGQGIQRFVNGDIYKGYYQNGKPSGFGQYYWKNKCYFKGYFKNGLRNGQGLWKRGAGNCDKYQGQYQNDKKWGYGVFTWANGNVFQGNYTGDLRNGYGQMLWTDGSYYKGNWKDGVQHGKGTFLFIYNSGQLFILREGLRFGIFQNNEIIKIQFEEPCVRIETQENEQQQEQNLRVNKNSKRRKLVRNSSKESHFSSKSKRTKLSAFTKQKTLVQQRKQKTLLSSMKKASHMTLAESKVNSGVQQHKQKTKITPLQKMRSIPLIQLFESQNSRYKSATNKQLNAFRITKKQPVVSTHKISQSFDQKIKKQTDPRRKSRILHSSFYLHKFKNIGKSPTSNNIILQNNDEHKPFFKQKYSNNSNLYGNYANSES